MKELQVTKALCFVESPPQGWIMQWTNSEAKEMDVFAVGLNSDSLAKCYEAVKSFAPSWRNRDGSLEVKGTPASIELSFKGHASSTKSLILDGDELTRFVEVLGQIVHGKAKKGR